MKVFLSRWFTGATLIGLAFGHPAFASMEWVNLKLLEFQIDPKSFMNSQKNVSKYDPETLEPIQIVPKFSLESIQSRSYVAEKDRIQKTAKIYHEGRAPFLQNDLAENLVDELRITQLQAMEDLKLMSSTLDESPWSDNYWPIYRGTLAYRYSDPKFPDSKDWKENTEYVKKHSCAPVQKSPAEKYDELVGDHTKTLTKMMIQEGKEFYEENGKVEPWMGICHGWAPASFAIPRPTHAITVLAANGEDLITFYPSDIKALASLLWANASPPTRFIGGRCDIPNPPEDENGRIKAQDCFDTNPGTWHLAVVNQIGVNRRSFIMDSTYDYEVWNQPGLSYQYTYFNPRTKKKVKSFKEAIVLKSEFPDDLFSSYRSPEATSFVGIAMQFVYIAETPPTTRSPDSPKYDRKVAVNYLYDLELDEQGHIIGGEWYHQQHPDFLWVPSPDGKALSVGDEYLDQPNMSKLKDWDGSGPIPSHWAKAAKKASKRSQPLSRIVDLLVELSNSQ